MRAGLHDVPDDGFLAQLLARLQTMQPFHQDETFAVLPHQDRALQADLEDADQQPDLAGCAWTLSNRYRRIRVMMDH